MQEDYLDPRLEEISDCLYRVAAKAVIIQDNKMLMVEETPGGFGVPGGGIDLGQTTHETIIRELEEELGVVINPSFIHEQPSFVGVSGAFKGLPRVTMYYVLKSGHPSINPKAVELTYRWVTKSDLETLNLRPNIATVRAQLLDLFV